MDPDTVTWQVGDVVGTGTPGDTRIWIRVRTAPAEPDDDGDPTWIEVHGDTGRDGFHFDGVFDGELPPDPVLLVRAGKPAATPEDAV